MFVSVHHYKINTNKRKQTESKQAFKMYALVILTMYRFLFHDLIKYLFMCVLDHIKMVATENKSLNKTGVWPSYEIL